MNIELIYIVGVVVFLILAYFVRKTNKIISKIFTTIGIGAIVLTLTNFSQTLSLHFNNPIIAKVCTAISILFFIFIIIKFWIKTIKIFIIILLISIFAFYPTIINTYHNFEHTINENIHNVNLEKSANDLINTVNEK